MRFQSVMSLALWLLSVINLLYILRSFKALISRPQLQYSYRGHDHPQYLPFSDELVEMVIEESVHYPLQGLASDGQWDSLSSESYGYVRLGTDDRLFAVTMFHELHCLRMLNFAFGKEGIATPEHIRHCLGYLRDGILCTPDLTLEPGDFEERDFEVERMGATHFCRDWSAVYPIMDENYAVWKAKPS
ncbi:uncharacterized protein LAESUDRAFT_739017 [Laetiporus sulphureus 93-53]|uniref:Oxidase ustYa n=1 Tax=Laetiporus sulphureus 93-53 TaxID=1314785 RepID=A0A165BWR5_9APHY|nr:uncharacterized protein LAESUDRAFT_739017 [Laetiporus sulphureus 93-53]KZT01793.1 hypothetical protein LAESUDRAFT_739017 [Laetiporus sulphureus 93-53]